MNPSEIINKLKRITKIDPFVESRKKEVVEVRALLCYLLREKRKLRLIAIKKIFLENGRQTNNATILHALKNYEAYSRSNESLKEIESQFKFKAESADEILKSQILESRLRILERKLRNCEKETKKNIGNYVLRE